MTPANDRPDNLFGICHALGEDLGFDPLWLRIGIAVAFLVVPVQVTIAYFAAGAVLLAARLVFPRRCTKAMRLVASNPPAPATEPIELARAA